jgi:hypothetical protein
MTKAKYSNDNTQRKHENESIGLWVNNTLLGKWKLLIKETNKKQAQGR